MSEPKTISKMNIFVEGRPGVGKTTFLIKLAKNISLLDYSGFYTEEIREKGVRQGFKIATFDGLDKIFAHVEINSLLRVSKYGVDRDAIENVVKHLQESELNTELWLIDEIGKMESLSPIFRSFIEKIIGSPVPVIATIALAGGHWIEGLKNRNDVQLFELTKNNREAAMNSILYRIKNKSED